MPHAPAASPVRAGAGAILALTIASATMFMIPYSTQAIVPEIGSSLDVGPAMTGLTITVVVIGIALGAWLMGPLSDRIGRREVMFGSCALLAVPTLLIAGGEDVVFPPFLASAIATSLPCGQAETIADAGHSPYFEQAARFNELVDAFLARQL